VPVDSIVAGYHLMSGHGDETDALKTLGPLMGLTFSKGAPGGPEVGVLFDAEKRHQDEMARAMPGIKEDIKNGNMQDAIQAMEDAHFTPQEQRVTLKYAMNPQARLNRNRMAKFEQIAPLEDLERMQRMQEEAEQSQSTQP
jgi:RecA-family ATPase